MAKRLISLLLAFCLFASFFGTLPQAYAAEAIPGFGYVDPGNGKKTSAVYDQPNGKTIERLADGTGVSILGQEEDENGDLWYHIRYTPEVSGYMPKSEISLDNPTSNYTTARVGFVNEKVTSCLLVRSEPSEKNYTVLDRLYCGDKVTIIGTRTIDGIKWYRIRTTKGNEGWVKAEYISLTSNIHSSPSSPAISKLERETIDEYGHIISPCTIYEIINNTMTPSSVMFTGGEKIKLLELVSDNNGRQYYYFQFGELRNYIDKDNALRVSEEEFHGRPVSIDTSKKGTVNKLVTSHLMVRSSPSEKDFSILDRLYCGDQVSIIQTTTIQGVKWYRVLTEGGIEGWVKARYIDIDSVKEEQNPSSSDKVKREPVTGTGRVLRRTTAHKFYDRNSKEDLTFLGGEFVSLFELITIGKNQKYGCQFGSKVYYVNKADISTSIPNNTSTPDSSKVNLAGVVQVRTRLSGRSQPSTSADVVEYLYNGASVEVLETKVISKTKWYFVKTQNGNKVWCLAAYITTGTWKRISISETYNYRSGENSRYNAWLVSSRLTGFVITPNQTFSWVNIVGECGKDQGYRKAKVIVNSQYVDGYGGGVCQVSTTINIAIKQTGIHTIRRPHSLPSVYAEREDEATVSYPNVDFRFINTKNEPIKLVLSASNGYCTCEVYLLVSD